MPYLAYLAYLIFPCDQISDLSLGATLKNFNMAAIFKMTATHCKLIVSSSMNLTGWIKVQLLA